ncbi:MAG TPA: lipase family protein [Longimicrobium sp.]|nr:lipase family protein [Longimicrobium sp.]
MDAAIAGTSTGYDVSTAQFLSSMVGLAYEQFDTPWPNGEIPAAQLPNGYTQVAAFKVPELDLDAAIKQFLAANPDLAPLVHNNPPTAANAAAQAALNQRLAAALDQFASLSQVPIATGTASGVPATSIVPQWFGFALAPTSDNVGAPNIIAIRGTRTIEEWALDATAYQIPVPLVWFNNQDELVLARVHLGFLILFAFLRPQLDAAFKQFNPQTGAQVAGHSLGSALATLAAVYTGVVQSPGQVQMYNQASPRVGDPAFVGAFNALVPSAYRIVNLSDLVPELPPTTITLPLQGTVTYGHVGQEWDYLWQTGNVGGNHFYDTNYSVAVANSYPTNGECNYRNYGQNC